MKTQLHNDNLLIIPETNLESNWLYEKYLDGNICKPSLLLSGQERHGVLFGSIIKREQEYYPGAGAGATAMSASTINPTGACPPLGPTKESPGPLTEADAGELWDALKKKARQEIDGGMALMKMEDRIASWPPTPRETNLENQLELEKAKIRSAQGLIWKWDFDPVPSSSIEEIAFRSAEYIRKIKKAME